MFGDEGEVMNVPMIMGIAENGVSWNKKGKKGYAICPFCGKKLLVKSTQGEIRYCKCRDENCVSNLLNITIKAS